MLQPARLDLTFLQSVNQTEAFRLMVDSKPRAPFKVSSPYIVGDFVTKVTDDGSVFLVTTAGTSTSSEPTWPTVMGDKVTSGGAVFMKVDVYRLLDTATYSARIKVRDEPSGTVLLSGSDADGRVEIGYSPGKWTTGHAYGASQEVVPTVLNGWRYRVETAGTSHASTEPTWPTTLGAVVTDNTVVWRNIGTDDIVSNLRVALTAAYTDTLTDWGVGVYQIDLISGSGVRQPVIWGNAQFSLKISEA